LGLKRKTKVVLEFLGSVTGSQRHLAGIARVLVRVLGAAKVHYDFIHTVQMLGVLRYYRASGHMARIPVG
jgi:hypothetical protein